MLQTMPFPVLLLVSLLAGLAYRGRGGRRRRTASRDSLVCLGGNGAKVRRP